MKKPKFNLTVKFHDIGSATITGLTQEQIWQAQDVCRLIETRPPNYHANGALLYNMLTETAYRAPTWGVRARAAWRRLNLWLTAGLLIFCALSVPVVGQERKPEPLEPVRVSLKITGEAARGAEAGRLIRGEMPRDVVIVTRNADYAIQIAVAPLTEDNQCRGVVGAMLVQDTGDEAHLSVFIADGLPSLARQLAERLDQEFFKSRRRR